MLIHGYILTTVLVAFMEYNGEYKTVFNSELAVKVLSVIGSRNQDYGSSIAKTLGKSQASISRVLGNLHDLGFIEKAKREKAQFYKIDYDSIGDFWYEFVYRKLEESNKEVHRKKWMVDEYTDKQEMLEGFVTHREQIIDNISRYSKQVFEGGSSLQNLTVADIFFEQFGLSIGHNMINCPGFLDRNPHLEYPKDALIHLWNMEGFAQELNAVVRGEDHDKSMMIIKKAE